MKNFKIHKSLLPLLEKNIVEEKDLDSLAGASVILRAFHHSDCLLSLLKILEINAFQNQVQYNTMSA